MTKKRITINESEFAAFTISIDDDRQFTLSFEQTQRLIERLMKLLPPQRRSRATKCRYRWRQIKARHYNTSEVKLQQDLDGEWVMLWSIAGKKSEPPTVREFISYLEESEQPRALEYFQACGAK